MFSSNTSQVSSDALFIEDVFSTTLYTGNGSTQTITNGIDLSTYDGLVWCKNRAQVSSHELSITRSDLPLILRSNATDASQQGDISGFHSAGFFLQNVVGNINQNNQPCVSWTFREQPKFFDVVTWVGNGSGAGIDVSHALGSKPGMVVMKRTDSTSNWMVMHRLNDTDYRLLRLNTTDANLLNTDGSYYTSTSFRAYQFNQDTGVAADNMNVNGATYVAYLFAHNAGGFGLTGTDNVISCGSYTGNGSATGPEINLGYEPQWVLIKSASGATGDWAILDNMRGWTVAGQPDAQLYANLSGAESSASRLYPNSTGFGIDSTSLNYNTSGATYIYIAIRRGPMKTPTSGTSVFAMDTQGSTTPRPPSYKSGFPVDWAYTKDKGTVGDWYVGSRLTGTNYLSFNLTITESPSASYKFDYQNGWLNSTAIDSNRQSWMFRRAPGFFDEVCYTGTGSARTVAHNLGVAPELMILKRRDSSGSEWPVYAAPLGATQGLYLGPYSDPAITTSGYWNNTAPTSTVFTVGNASAANFSGSNLVAYLFASCPGVSKVGSYTGNGSSQTINCGFTGGARFVLIKRTDSTGDWYVWDSARGIVAGNDPYLLLNSTAAEVTSTDYIDPVSSGFEISSTAPAAINANGGTFIYLAIA